MVVRRFLVLAAGVVTMTLAPLTWLVAAGTAVAGADTRLRSGSVHAQLVSHLSSGAHTLSPSLALKGSDVMAAIVGILAVLALAFLIVTFIRRRITTA